MDIIDERSRDGNSPSRSKLSSLVAATEVDHRLLVEVTEGGTRTTVCEGLASAAAPPSVSSPEMSTETSSTDAKRQQLVVSLLELSRGPSPFSGADESSIDPPPSDATAGSFRSPSPRNQRLVLPIVQPAKLEHPTVRTSSLILCGVCSAAFATSEECCEHMLRAHESMVKYPGVDEPSRSSAEERPGKRFRKPSARYGDYAAKPILPRDPSGAGRPMRRCPRKGCLMSFTEANLPVHEGCHVDGAQKRFRCPLAGCDNLFEAWPRCSMHLWAKHGIDVGLYGCPMCDAYKTVNQSKLDVHMLVHSEERSFACSVCLKQFKQLSQLRHHSVIHVDRAKGAPPAWYAKKKCETCGKHFSDSKCLKKHVQTVHNRLKPYICHVCNHQSARKSMLELHVRQHTGEKPFRCDACEYRTADHNSLRRHKMIHSGEKPYKCAFCSYSCIQADTYKNHVQTKHGDKDAVAANVHACSQCSFKTVKAESYSCHVRLHKEAPALLGKDGEEESRGCEGSASPGAKTSQKPDASRKVRRKQVLVAKVAIPLEEEDSLHAAPTDHGGTTIPADSTN